jgi:hypothetical protein
VTAAFTVLAVVIGLLTVWGNVGSVRCRRPAQAPCADMSAFSTTIGSFALQSLVSPKICWAGSLLFGRTNDT